MWQISEDLGSGRREMSPDDFKNRFLDICQAHREQGRALAFAFILYDNRHPHVRRMLNDDAYWDSLDHLSAQILTVFSFHLHERQPKSHSGEPTLMHMMVGIPQASMGSPSDVLSEHFDGLSVNDLPCVLFFQIADGKVIGSLAVAMRSQNSGTEATYNELTEVLSCATESLRNVDDENAVNAKEVFDLIGAAMHERSIKNRALRVFEAAKRLTSIAGLLRLLYSLI